MEQASNSSVSVPIMNAQRVSRQLAVSGREGLENLLAAIRRMVSLLLAPFRAVARLVYKIIPIGGQAAVGANHAVAPVSAAKSLEGDGGMDDVASGFARNPHADKDDHMQDVEVNKLLDKVEAHGGGSLELVMTGAPEELQAIMPMLLRHVDQILAAHLPAGADEAKLTARLVSLAETSESTRYAHRIVSRQIEGALKLLIDSKQYLGVSKSTVEELVRAGAGGEKTDDLGGRSAEEQLLAALQLRDKLEQDFKNQTHLIARLITDAAATEDLVPGEPDSEKRLMTKVLGAADMARFKLRVHERGMVGLADTLPETPEQLSRIMTAAQNAVAERAALTAAPAADAGGAEATLVAGSGEAAAVAAAGTSSEKFGETPVAAVASGVKDDLMDAVAPPAPAAHVPQAPKAAVKAVERAKVVRVASAGGMFGGQSQRSAQELAEVVASRDFDTEDEEGEQPLVSG